MNRNEIQSSLENMGLNLLLMDGFDEAFIGITSRINESETAVYSYEKMVNLLIERDGMTEDDAIEYIEFNCQGAWVGDQTPHIVRQIEF